MIKDKKYQMQRTINGQQEEPPESIFDEPVDVVESESLSVCSVTILKAGVVTYCACGRDVELDPTNMMEITPQCRKCSTLNQMECFKPDSMCFPPPDAAGTPWTMKTLKKRIEKANQPEKTRLAGGSDENASKIYDHSWPCDSLDPSQVRSSSTLIPKKRPFADVHDPSAILSTEVTRNVQGRGQIHQGVTPFKDDCPRLEPAQKRQWRQAELYCSLHRQPLSEGDINLFNYLFDQVIHKKLP